MLLGHPDYRQSQDGGTLLKREVMTGKGLAESKRIVRNLLLVSILFAFQLGTLGTGFGRPFRLGKIPDKGKNFGCASCHVDPKGGGKRNAFGRDFFKYGFPIGDRYTEELGQLDSDGDGFTNDEEFAGKTHPGDPNSKPTK
jgi:hypothetical protein